MPLSDASRHVLPACLVRNKKFQSAIGMLGQRCDMHLGAAAFDACNVLLQQMHNLQCQASMVSCVQSQQSLMVSHAFHADAGKDAGLKQWNVYSDNIMALNPVLRQNDGNYEKRFEYGTLDQDTAPYDVGGAWPHSV